MIVPLLLASLTVQTAAGRVETLFPARDRRATVVFVVLAECPIARQFSPEIARVARAYAKRGVRCLMAFADAEPAAIRVQMSAYALPFPGARASRQLVRYVGATAVPTAAVIAADGRLIYAGRIDDRFPVLGAQREVRRHDLRLALDAFLAGKAVAVPRTSVIGCALPTEG